LLDDLHLSLACDALGVPNNPNKWMKNSQRFDYGWKILFEVVY